jgi:hypothetical protein
MMMMMVVTMVNGFSFVESPRSHQHCQISRMSPSQISLEVYCGWWW